MKRVALLAIPLVCLCLAFTYGQNRRIVDSTGENPTLVVDEIILKFSPHLTHDQKAYLEIRHGLQKKRESYRRGEFTVYRHQEPAAVLNRLKDEAGVIYAERNGSAHACLVPNDPLFTPYQWNLVRIGMHDAWDLSTGEGAVVAVLDSGVKQSLADLQQTDFTSGWDFVNNDGDPSDDNGHGSHICGTVAQSTHNLIGTAGIAYACTIMPVKVLDQDAEGTYDDIADGIYYAVDNGAHVINLSLTGSASSTALEDAVNYAWNHGVLVVCAAGGDGTDIPMYPAACVNAVAVSATNYLDQITAYSNYGPHIDISAPGGEDIDYTGDGYPEAILQNTIGPGGDGYYFYSGTSSAAAHVTGTAALIKACKPFFDCHELRNILENTAVDLGETGPDSYYGRGRLDAAHAVQTAMSYPLCLYVSDIDMSAFNKGKRYWTTATVTIVDTSSQSNPVPDATVYVTWSGVVTGSDSGVTGPDGTVTFVSDYAKSPGPFVITVNHVQHEWIPYCPSYNSETSDSINY